MHLLYYNSSPFCHILERVSYHYFLINIFLSLPLFYLSFSLLPFLSTFLSTSLSLPPYLYLSLYLPISIFLSTSLSLPFSLPPYLYISLYTHFFAFFYSFSVLNTHDPSFVSIFVFQKGSSMKLWTDLEQLMAAYVMSITVLPFSFEFSFYAYYLSLIMIYSVAFY